MAEVVWLDGASDQLDAIADYIEQFNPDAAGSVAKRLAFLAASLSHLPRRGRPASDGTRELTSVRPYIIRYRLSDDGTVATIVSIRHTRRRPL